MVKFSHSLFALPFALAGAALAAADGPVSLEPLLWIVLATLCARNAAMGFNRLVDQTYDALNPRTRERELPAGRLSRGAVWIFTTLLAALFVLASFQLHPLCGWLSPLALLIIFGYSYTKRFTWLSHLILGLALSLAPMGSWLAIRGSLSAVACLLGAAVLLWVAGFDVIYNCQDVDFDRRHGLHSLPARFGIQRSLLAARALHAGALAALAGIGFMAELHPVYWAGWLVIACLIVWEHRLVSGRDLSRLNVAFFHLNGAISVLYLVTILTAVMME